MKRIVRKIILHGGLLWLLYNLIIQDVKFPVVTSLCLIWNVVRQRHHSQQLTILVKTIKLMYLTSLSSALITFISKTFKLDGVGLSSFAPLVLNT